MKEQLTPIPTAFELAEDPFFQELQEIFAEFFEGFGFKANFGRIWSVLFYSTQALSQREIVQILGLSTGMVSQGLNELLRFGMICSQQDATRRENLYQTEQNLTQIVSSILSKREIHILDRLYTRIETLKQRLATSQHDQSTLRIRLQRLDEVLTLCNLARAIVNMIGSFSQYSYHAVTMGIRVISKLKVSELPKILSSRFST